MEPREIESRLRNALEVTRIPIDTDFSKTSPGSSSWLLSHGKVIAISAAVLAIAAIAGFARTVTSSQGSTQIVSPANGVAGPNGVGPTSNPSASGLTPEEWDRQNQMSKIVNELVAFAKSGDPLYDLTEMNVKDSSLRIYRADAKPERLADTYRRMIPTWIGLDFAPARLSAQQKDELNSVVSEKLSVLKDRGIVVTLWGSEETLGGKYVIYYDPNAKAPSAQDLQQFQIFGQDTVVFQPGAAVGAGGVAST